MQIKSGIYEFELEILGYQFPHLEREPYDSDWLKIGINVSVPRGSWSAVDACLLTWEVERLAQWLDSVASDEVLDLEEDFIEPNLRFELDGFQPRILKVYFELEVRPSWAPADAAGKNDLWAEFELDPEQLKDAAASLRRQLEKYPVRAGF